MNVARVLADRATALGAKEAIRCDGASFTYADVDQEIERCAAALLGLGIGAGDRVAVQLPKGPEVLFLHFGILSLGAIALPLNTEYRAEEVAYFLEDSGACLFVTDRPHQAVVERAIADLPGLTVLTAEDGWREALEHARLPFARPYAARDHDTAMLCYTSGTTGRSKGAMITHRNLLSNAEALHAIWGWSEADVLLHVLPLFHVHGLNVAALGCLHAGATMVLQRKFEPRRAWEALAAEGCTLLMAVPTIYQRLMQAWEELQSKPDLSRVRLFVSGSAPLSEVQFQRFERLTGFRILERYGMTETGMIASNRLDPAGRVAKSVGFALPGVEVRVVAEGGADAAPGAVAEVWVRGLNVFRGYWGMPEKTRESFVDGWFRTGDLGWRDPADGGRLYLAGRAKELIITGGYNVYPKEIENVLEGHPGVKEAAVFGQPDEDLGEAVVAVVVPRESGTAALATDLAAALDATCREQLAGYKRPKRIHLAAELPRNAMGKLQKNLLAERYK